MSFRTGPSVFKDRAKVSFDYVPQELPHRERSYRHTGRHLDHRQQRIQPREL